MSALQASRKYGVPSRTLYDKVKKMGITTGRQMQKKSLPNYPASFPPLGVSLHFNCLIELIILGKTIVLLNCHQYKKCGLTVFLIDLPVAMFRKVSSKTVVNVVAQFLNVANIK